MFWGGVTKNLGGWQIFFGVGWQNIFGMECRNILEVDWEKHFCVVRLLKNFAAPPPKICSTLPYCFPLHHNIMSLVQFQHLCVNFLHLNIYVCLPNESVVCSFTPRNILSIPKF